MIIVVLVWCCCFNLGCAFVFIHLELIEITDGVFSFHHVNVVYNFNLFISNSTYFCTKKKTFSFQTEARHSHKEVAEDCSRTQDHNKWQNVAICNTLLFKKMARKNNLP